MGKRPTENVNHSIKEGRAARYEIYSLHRGPGCRPEETNPEKVVPLKIESDEAHLCRK
jgi:hypothetical protein